MNRPFNPGGLCKHHLPLSVTSAQEDSDAVNVHIVHGEFKGEQAI